MILVFDTETTGKVDFRADYRSVMQPKIVQIGAQLLDNDWAVRGEINLIIKPDGWTIPKEASNIHGITQGIAMVCGTLELLALQIFTNLAVHADTIVCHNVQFDKLVLLARLHAHKEFTAQHYAGRKYFCTMHATTHICKLPGNYGHYKWPKLQEAHKHAFGEEFDGAHDAMADVRACARLYRWLMEKEVAA